MTFSQGQTTTTNGEQGRGGGGITPTSLQRELQARGVIASLESLLSSASLDGIRRSIEWFDHQSDVGPGVLVEVIRRGGVTEQPQAKSVLDREREYGESVCDWLNEHFADLRQASGHPHPAAIAAAIQLHHRDGKGSLTKRRHGKEIRAAVAAFDEKWGTS